MTRVGSQVPVTGTSSLGTSSPVPTPYKGEPGKEPLSGTTRREPKRRSREGIDAKAGRLLADQRVWVEHVDRDAGIIRALVLGDSDRYVVWKDGYEWRCSCAAYRKCSHIAAVALVTDPRHPKGRP